jgi:hypothetical protein
MALADRLHAATYTYQQKSSLCKLMQVTLDPKLSEEDSKSVLAIINSQPGDEAHVPNIRLAYALRAEGYDVSPSAVDRHRRNICACSRPHKGE